MSVEFYLIDSNMSMEEWANCTNLFLEEKEIEAYEGIKSEDCLFVSAPGSARGVQIDFASDEHIKFRLAVLASRVDWQLAFGILRKGMVDGGGQLLLELAEELKVEDLTDDRLTDFWMKDYMIGGQMTREAIEKGEGQLKLPCGAFEIRIAPDMLPEGSKPDELMEFEAKLSTAFSKYAEAFQASIFTFGAKSSNKSIRVANWAQIPTILGHVDAVSFCGITEDIKGVVPLADVIEILGERAEKLDDHVYYLPGVNFEEEPELVNALEAKVCEVDDIEPGDWDASDLSDGLTGEQINLITSVVEKMLGSLIKGGDPMVAAFSIIAEQQGQNAALAMRVMTATMKALQTMMEDQAKVQDPDDMIDFLVSECELDKKAATIVFTTMAEYTQKHPEKKKGCGAAAILLIAGLLMGLVYLLN